MKCELGAKLYYDGEVGLSEKDIEVVERFVVAKRTGNPYGRQC